MPQDSSKVAQIALWSVVVVPVFVILLLHGAYFRSNHPPVSFTTFDSTFVQGPIQYIETGSHDDYFGVRGTYYKINTTGINFLEQTEFQDESRVGDSIVKRRGSDTLTLFTKTGKHLYRVIRPIN